MNQELSIHVVIRELERNGNIFQELLTGMEKSQYTWRADEESWSLLEIICHLFDEEVEDFRPRMQHLFDGNKGMFSPIDPPAWVEDRKYMEQDFEERIAAFLREREASLHFLEKHISSDWAQHIVHPRVGAIYPRDLMMNWLAHDYLHLRQITKLKYDMTSKLGGVDISYAGVWK
ncbi:MAG: DinB family protein [Bacteroidota bacterium]